MDETDPHPSALKVANSEQPERMPTRPMGNLPVLARLVLDDGTERWQVAAANRWTASHVLVVWQNDPRDPHSTQLCWLRAADVTRRLTGPSELLGPLWEQLEEGE